jgi:hypothetical protein
MEYTSNVSTTLTTINQMTEDLDSLNLEDNSYHTFTK